LDRQGVTPWETGQANPILRELVEAGEADWKGRVLVPGCGMGYDALVLASPDREVIGLDLSPIAVTEANRVRDAAGLTKEQVSFLAGDFFSLDAKHGFDLIVDSLVRPIHPKNLGRLDSELTGKTPSSHGPCRPPSRSLLPLTMEQFFCALPPKFRSRWAHKMMTLVEPKQGELFTLIHPIGSWTDGPPYAVSPQLVKDTLEPVGFHAKELRPSTMEGRWIGRWKL